MNKEKHTTVGPYLGPKVIFSTNCLAVLKTCLTLAPCSVLF